MFKLSLSMIGQYEVESFLSMMALQPLQPNIQFGKGLGKLNKVIYEKLISPQFKNKFTHIRPILQKHLPKITQLDMGWLGYPSDVHKALKVPQKILKGTIKETLDDVAEAELKKIVSLTRKSGKILAGMSMWQRTQMWSIGLTIAEAIGTQAIESKKRAERLRYYRRLQGITGSINPKYKDSQQFSKQEEQIIMRSLQNAMVTRQILNDQGVFGTNPYIAIYG